MLASSSDDPLELSGLDPGAIQGRIDARDKKVGKAPSELELQKEQRLAEKEKRLNTGSGSGTKKSTPPSAPPIAPPPPEMDKSPLLDKIAAYRERFPHLKKRNNVTAKSSLDEIFDELHYLELQLGSSSGGGSSFGTAMLCGTMLGVETFTRDYWNPLGLNLTGLGQVTRNNAAEFQPIIDELMIKHNAGMYTSPEWRLALALGASMMTVHAANNNPDLARAMKNMNNPIQPPTSATDL